MKKITTAICLVIVFLLSACGPTRDEAVSYNDSIMNIIDSLSMEHTLLLEQIDGHNIDSLKITHTLFTEKAKASLERSKKILPFAEKKEFCNAAVIYFSAMVSLADNEVKQMVEIMEKGQTKISQFDLDKINFLASAFDEAYGLVYDKILAVQIQFAKDWNFTLEDNKS